MIYWCNNDLLLRDNMVSNIVLFEEACVRRGICLCGLLSWHRFCPSVHFRFFGFWVSVGNLGISVPGLFINLCLIPSRKTQRHSTVAEILCILLYILKCHIQVKNLQLHFTLKFHSTSKYFNENLWSLYYYYIHLWHSKRHLVQNFSYNSCSIFFLSTEFLSFPLCFE